MSLKGREQKVLVHRNLPWKDARYVLATIDENGVFSCQGLPLHDDDGWRKALAFEENGVLRLTWAPK